MSANRAGPCFVDLLGSGWRWLGNALQVGSHPQRLRRPRVNVILQTKHIYKKNAIPDSPAPRAHMLVYSSSPPSLLPICSSHRFSSLHFCSLHCSSPHFSFLHFRPLHFNSRQSLQFQMVQKECKESIQKRCVVGPWVCSARQAICFEHQGSVPKGWYVVRPSVCSDRQAK